MGKSAVLVGIICVNVKTSIFGSFLRSKNGTYSTPNALIMGKNDQFLPKHAFLPSLYHFDGF